MPLYTPEHFRADTDEAHALIDAHSLGLLITGGNEPDVTPVPVLLDRGEGEFGALRFHLARANAQATALGQTGAATLVFQGAGTYVSPDWYTDPKLPPTWNYEVVVAHGRAFALDADGLRILLDDLSWTWFEGIILWTSMKLLWLSACLLACDWFF